MFHETKAPPADTPVWIHAGEPRADLVASLVARRLRGEVKELREQLLADRDQRRAFICAAVSRRGELRLEAWRCGRIPPERWVVGAYVPSFIEQSEEEAAAWIGAIVVSALRVTRSLGLSVAETESEADLVLYAKAA